jgi:predicted DNA binding CopG/RHH family protein
MKREYDLSAMKSRPNPFASRLRQQVTLRLRRDTIQYFKELAEETGLDYTTLIDLYLEDCAEKRRRPSIAWDSQT